MRTANRERINECVATPSSLGRLKRLLKNAHRLGQKNKLRFEVPIWNERAFDDLKALRDPDLLKRLVRKCFEDAGVRLNQLRAARIAGHWHLWREYAHGMHGIALYLGAVRLSQAVSEVLDLDDFDQAAEFEAEFTRHLADVRDVLAPLLG
jgi:HPt (histidine-containing phosphotransfer) domain-containing protein